MNQLKDLYAANTMIVWMILSTVAVLLLIYYNRRRLEYTLMKIDYSMPLFGRLSRILRSERLQPDRDQWFRSENRVCADFARFYNRHNHDAAYFEGCRQYLDAVEELPRRQMPLAFKLMIVGMIVAEAFGFSYVLTLWGFAQAAAKDVPFLAASLASLLGVVAVWLTHNSGHELYLNKMAERVRRDFVADPNKGKAVLQRTQHTVRLDLPQDADIKEIPSLRMLNRLKRRPSEISRTWTIIAFIYIAIIAVGSTYIRVKAFEVDRIDQHEQTVEQQFVQSSTVQVGSDLPGDLQRKKDDSQTKVILDKDSANDEGAWATFTVMGAIFIAIQAMAIGMGYTYGFAGKESEAAWLATHGFANGADYEAFHNNIRDEISTAAQAKLETVHAVIMKRVEANPQSAEQIEAARNTSNRTFSDYLDLMADRQAEKAAAKSRKTTSPSPAIEGV